MIYALLVAAILGGAPKEFDGTFDDFCEKARQAYGLEPGDEFLQSPQLECELSDFYAAHMWDRVKWKISVTGLDKSRRCYWQHTTNSDEKQGLDSLCLVRLSDGGGLGGEPPIPFDDSVQIGDTIEVHGFIDSRPAMCVGAVVRQASIKVLRCVPSN